MPIPPGREMVVALDGELTGRFDVRRAYDEHGRVIFGFALNGIGDRGVAEDCVQETFLRAGALGTATAPRSARSAPGCSRSRATSSSTPSGHAAAGRLRCRRRW
jgi:hypothetical protein